jgi:hypothetical protein
MPTVREVQEVAVTADSGSFTLQRHGDPSRSVTINLADSLSAVQAALENLYGATGIQVERVGNRYRVTFGGTLAGLDVAPLEWVKKPTDAPGLDVQISTLRQGTTTPGTPAPGINYTGVDRLNINLGSGNDTLNVRSTSTDTHVDAGAGAGNDTVFVSSGAGTANRGNAEAINGPLSLEMGGGNNNRLIVDDYTGAANPNVVIDSSSITGLTPAPITYRATGGNFLDPNSAVLDGILVNGSNSGSNTFTVRSTLVGSTLTVKGGLSADSFNVGAPLTSLPNNPGDNGNLDLIQGRLTVVGNGGGDSLEVNDHAATGAFNYIVNPTSVTNSPAPQATAPLPLPAPQPPITPPARTFAGLVYNGTGTAAGDTIQNLRLDATDQINIFDVTPSKLTTLTVNGNGPASGSPIPGGGDYLRMNTAPLASGTGGRHLHIGSVGNGFWNFTDGTRNLNFQSIERFNHVAITATPVAGGPSSTPRVTVRDAETGEVKFTALAYESYFHGGVRVAVADVNNDGIPDLITTPGAGRAPTLRVFSGTPDINGNYAASLLTSFDAMPSSFLGGMNLAAGDVNGDGAIDVAVAASAAWQPEIRIYNGLTLLTTHKLIGALFNAFENTYRGGVSLAIIDLNKDGYGEVIAGKASAGPSTINVFSGAGIVSAPLSAFARYPASFLVKTFTAFPTSFQGGVNLAAGDVRGDGTNDIIVGAKAGWSPYVSVFSGTAIYQPGTVTAFNTYLAGPMAVRSGVTVIARKSDGGNPGYFEVVVIDTFLGLGG